MQIQSVDFHLGRDTQADDGINDLEDNEHHDQYISVDGKDPQSLDAQKFGPAAVEKALHDAVFAGGKESDRDRSPDAVDHVHRHGADRVVDLCDIIKKLY